MSRRSRNALRTPLAECDDHDIRGGPHFAKLQGRDDKEKSIRTLIE